MVPIQIDISGLVAQFQFSKEETRGFSRFLLDRLGREYMEIWENKVNDGLGSTRAAYKSGMKFSFLDDFNIEFELDGKGQSKLGLMIERGADAFDIKEGFRNSPKAKNPGQPDWYLTVPFRLATPEALAESSAFSGRMPKSIHQIAKQKGQVTNSDLPKEFQTLGVRPELNVSQNILSAEKQAEYTHKSPIYEGIQRSMMERHSHYTSFRRVSGKSEPNSWIHKGFEERDFMGKSLQDLSNNLNDIIDLAREQFIDSKFE